MKREMTPPTTTLSDPTLLHIHDRLHQLDNKVLDLRASVLTKDAYVDRRNREDESVRREFESHRIISSRIESVVGKTKADVGQLKTDLSQLKAEILLLRTHVDQLGSKEAFLHSDVSQIQNDVNQLQCDVQRLHTDVCATRTDVSQIQTIVSQLRIDLLTLQRDTSRQFGEVFNRFSMMEARMKQADRTRFNSLAHTIHAPVTPIPVLDDDGLLRWPEYFPRTVWKFWCLKRRNRIHRLVELAEFYQLEGYQYWGRRSHPHDSMFPGDGYMSDSSDSSDLPSDLTLSEAARQYPEACHQALAATLGLIYTKIRKEVGEAPHHHMAVKRAHDDVASLSSGKPKPPKAVRRSNDHSVPSLRQLVTSVPAVDTKSIVSEGLDKLGWNANASEMSDETMSKLKGIVSEEVNALVLQALERGRLRLQPSHMERGRTSPTESAKLSLRSRSNNRDVSATEDMCNGKNTVPTEIISPVSGQEDGRWVVPEQMSTTSSP